MKEIQNLIIGKFQINTGSEQLFLNSLFYNIFHMAKERDEINYSTLLEIVYFILNLCAKFSLKSQPSIYGKYGKWIL